MPNELQVKELVKSVQALKALLGDEGEYSIARSDRQPMWIGDSLVVGSVLERIDNAIKAVETTEQTPV